MDEKSMHVVLNAKTFLGDPENLFIKDIDYSGITIVFDILFRIRPKDPNLRNMLENDYDACLKIVRNILWYTLTANSACGIGSDNDNFELCARSKMGRGNPVREKIQNLYRVHARSQNLAFEKAYLNFIKSTNVIDIFRGMEDYDNLNDFKFARMHDKIKKKYKKETEAERYRNQLRYGWGGLRYKQYQEEWEQFQKTHGNTIDEDIFTLAKKFKLVPMLG